MNHPPIGRGAWMDLDRLEQEVRAACTEVHDRTGPGLAEPVYSDCLDVELASRGLKVERDRVIRFRYRTVRLVLPARVSRLVEDRLILEPRSLEEILPIHEARLRTQLRLAGFPLGLIVNFNVSTLRTGVTRVQNVPATRVSP